MILSFIAGLLLYCAFPPVALWWCAPLALALLIHVLHDSRLRNRVISMTIFGTAFFAPLLSWTNTYVGDTPWIILTILQILLVIPLGLIPFKKRSPWMLLLFPSIWLLIESVRTRFPFGGFGWGRVAFSQPNSPYSSLARIGGAPLLSFTAATIAVGIYLLFQKQAMPAFLIFLFIGVISLVGSINPIVQGPRTFSFVAVQGGVPTLGLDFNARATAVFENHLQATRNYLKSRAGSPDVVLWPENSIDVDPYQNTEVRQQLQALADDFNVPIIVGAVLQDGGNYQNASILWKPRTGSSSIYIKRHLTPFGEYIPLRAIAEIVSPYAKDVVDFLPGNRIVIHQVGTAKIAPIICFELLDDESGRSMASKSNAMVVQTNSATFGLSAESDQQLNITRIRAIEHQRYTVSISTSGVSALIDPRGRVTHRTLQNRTSIIDDSIRLIQSRSISDRHGFQIEIGLISIPILCLLALRWLSRRRSITP